MKFASRQDAGQRLGAHLLELDIDADVVLGLPRGGVLVGAEVARVLALPLEALVVRKIGHPMHREFAVGALAERGVVLLHEEMAGAGPTARRLLQEIIEEETRRLHAYESAFHSAGAPLLQDRHILLIDDGLATGSTMEAAVMSGRRQQARRVTVAVPVSSVEAAHRMSRLADAVVALEIDPDFSAVGCYYETFAQVSDEEVLEFLKRCRA
jgi:putative phosphoribosyl transferase